jgi:coenzyme F420-reducing hydrogenase delta subunit
MRAARLVENVQKYLDEIGIERERLEMVMMSAGMGYRFAQVATEMTEKIRKLGPSPIHVALVGKESNSQLTGII